MSDRIILDDRFLIDIDAHNYTLKRDLSIAKKEDGTEYETFKDPKYLSSIPSALKEYVKQCVKLKLKPKQDILDADFNKTLLRIEEKIDDIAKCIKTQEKKVKS